jgi:hypothetical protein
VDTAFAAIDDAIRVVLDRGDVLGADMAAGIDPHRGDAGGAKVVFREEFVARWLAHANAKRSDLARRRQDQSACLRHPCRLLEAPSPQAGVLHIRQIDHAVSLDTVVLQSEVGLCGTGSRHAEQHDDGDDNF